MDTEETVLNSYQSLEISPNPFNVVTSVKWLGAGKGPISLEVYDASGSLVKTLAKAQSQKPGVYTVIWDGCDEKGAHLPSGVYFCHLRTRESSITKKMVLMR